jgi:hypothetical protein
MVPMTESELWVDHFWHKFRNQIPKPFYAWNLSYWEHQSKEFFGPTKTVLEVLNDIEVWRADIPDGINITELFFQCLS